MVPYVAQPAFTVGDRTIYAFGVLVILAIAVGLAVVVLRAPKLGFRRSSAFGLTVWTIFCGLVGSHLVAELAYHPTQAIADPWILFDLCASMSSLGGIAGGVLGLAAFAGARGFSRGETLRFLDGVAFAFPFAWIFGRAGCALAHDHLGIASSHFLAVRFPAGPRFDLGLLELLATLPIAALFLGLDRRPRPNGLYLGLFFALYGPARFGLDFLRIEDARYFGWTPAQYLCVVATAASFAILTRVARRSSSN